MIQDILDKLDEIIEKFKYQFDEYLSIAIDYNIL